MKLVEWRQGDNIFLIVVVHSVPSLFHATVQRITFLVQCIDLSHFKMYFITV
jgi:hypothetical protein